MDILVSEEIVAPAIRKLGEKYQLLHAPELWSHPAKLRAAIRNVRAIMVRNQTKLTSEILSEADKLVAVGRVGVGLDNIDVDFATERGVVVIAPLNANATSVAELTLGLMLSLARKIPFSDSGGTEGAGESLAAEEGKNPAHAHIRAGGQHRA